MNKSILAMIVYVVGLIFGALVLELWSADTGPKAFIGMAWTIIFIIALYYADKYDQK
ncbi:hypothetical protein N9S39_04150 [Candidatus Pelagibacter sp.]|nr:hypothetical protein [Candidatus Pelagibacter sp.]